MLDLKPRGPSEERRDPDGVRIVQHKAKASGPTRLYQGLALLLASASLAYILMPRSAPPPPPFEPRPDQVTAALEDSEDFASTASPEASSRPVASARPHEPRRKATPRPVEPAETLDREALDDNDLAKYVGSPESLRGATMGDVIEALHDAGIHTGIGAFNPPGTSPPLVGVAVPPDFELPEGYVRHFQTTDDGQPIEPILMYSPDYEFLDADGNPVEIPEDRVVPPEHVPEGLEPRVIDIPEPREPGDLARESGEFTR